MADQKQVQNRSKVHSLIHDAVEMNDLGQVKILLKHASANAISHQASDGLTALLRACKNGYAKMAWVLLENGANIDDIDNEGNTCLHYAARQNDPELVQLLLKSCARTFIRNHEGMLPIDMAVESTSELISSKMMKDGPTEFVAACQRMKSAGKLNDRELFVLKDHGIVTSQARRMSLPTYLPEYP